MIKLSFCSDSFWGRHHPPGKMLFYSLSQHVSGSSLLVRSTAHSRVKIKFSKVDCHLILHLPYSGHSDVKVCHIFMIYVNV
jgi:hypothetical protein